VGGDENGNQSAMAAASQRFTQRNIDCALHNFGVEGATNFEVNGCDAFANFKQTINATRFLNIIS